MPRLLLTPPLTGADNMALDEVLLAQAATAGPAIRLYRWSPPAVSLGYGQPAAVADREACARHGVNLTRRLTGGRAVLHADELTYSVCVPAELLDVGRNVTLAYERLSGALIDGLSRLGLDAAMAPRHRSASAERDPACFATALGGDLSVDGRKLIGSAQCHKLGGILQHGSIPISVDEQLLSDCLRRPPGALRGWTCLAELGVEPDEAAFAEALADGFAPLFGERPSIGQPTAEELAAMRELAAAKYATEAWVARL